MQPSDTNHIYSDLDFSLDFEIRQEALNNLQERLTQAPIDIREALQTFNPKADTYQEKVITATAQTIRVVAPAGSGKTQTLINRVLHRIKEGLHPNRILFLTFDNAAISSLKMKLQEQIEKIEGINLDNLRIMTLNSFGYDILRTYVPSEYKPVIQDYRQRRLFQEVKKGLQEKSAQHYKILPTNIDNRFYIEFFSLLKNELFDPRAPESQSLADFLLKSEQASPFFQLSTANAKYAKQVIQSIIWLFKAYEIAMSRERVLDFDDQKLRAYISLHDSLNLRNER